MSKFVRHKKKDDNHHEIANEFIRLGCGVRDVSSLPDFVDILVTYAGHTIAVEIKDGSKVPSARRLTAGEEKFRDYWTQHGGKWACIETIEQANEMIKGIKQYWVDKDKDNGDNTGK